MNTIVNYGITAFFIMLFVGVSIYGYKTFWVAVKKRQNDLQNTTKILKNTLDALHNERLTNTQSYAKIDNAFLTNTILKTTWKQYR